MNAVLSTLNPFNPDPYSSSGTGPVVAACAAPAQDVAAGINSSSCGGVEMQTRGAEVGSKTSRRAPPAASVKPEMTGSPSAGVASGPQDSISLPIIFPPIPFDNSNTNKFEPDMDALYDAIVPPEPPIFLRKPSQAFLRALLGESA